MKRLTLVSCTVALVLAWAVVRTARADTPDGETPAEETFCDDNFTGRLRGLCNAFCEATDCDSLDTAASAKACGKLQGKIDPLLAAYNAAHGTDLEIRMADAVIGEPGNCGRRPRRPLCPCGEAEDIVALFGGPENVRRCSDDGTFIQIIGTAPSGALVTVHVNAESSCRFDGPETPIDGRETEACNIEIRAAQAVLCTPR